MSSISTLSALSLWDRKLWIPGQHSIAIIGSKIQAHAMLLSLTASERRSKDEMYVSYSEDVPLLWKKDSDQNDDEKTSKAKCLDVCRVQEQKVQQITKEMKNEDQKINKEKNRIAKMQEQSFLWIHFGQQPKWIQKPMLLNARHMAISVIIVTTNVQDISLYSRHSYDWYFIQPSYVTQKQMERYKNLFPESLKIQQLISQAQKEQNEQYWLVVDMHKLIVYEFTS